MDLHRFDSIFHSPPYLRITQRRLEHLASLDLDLANKTVLDVGAGIGDFASFYLDQGCRVTAVEPRRDNVEFLRFNLEQSGALQRGALHVVEDDFWSLEQHETRYDVVHAYGVLYHLDDPVRALRILRNLCSGVLLLETCVTNDQSSGANVVQEPKENMSQAIDGLGCRPHRRWLYDEVSKLFPLVYMPSSQPNHEQFPIDWSIAYGPDTLQRSIYIAADRPLQARKLDLAFVEKYGA